MTDVSIDVDKTDVNPTDDGNYGIRFEGAINNDDAKSAILTRVTINGADEENIRIARAANNLTMEDCTISNNQGEGGAEEGIVFHTGTELINDILINNST